jgi:transposase
MRKNQLSDFKQVRLMKFFVAGTTARYAAELVSVGRKKAAYCLHCL